MQPAAPKANSYSNKTVLKSVGERHLGLKNEIIFDREKGSILINPRLYIQENDHQTASGLLGKITQKLNGLINRYHEWQAKEWFVRFVEKNFEKNKKTSDLLDSIKSSGRVSSSNLLETLVDKGYKFSSVGAEFQADGSLRSRFLIGSKDQVIDKIITADLKNKGFSDDAISAFLHFFHHSEQYWDPGSFKDVMEFLNQYSDRGLPHSSVFLMPALQNKVADMQIAATEFYAFQKKSDQIKLRKNKISTIDVEYTPKFSRKDLCDFLKNSWGFSKLGKNKEGNVKNVFENPLQITFIRYLESGTKNMDSDSLRNLISYPKLIKLYPHLYGFPGGAKANNNGLGKIFDDVVVELTAMSNQKKSEEIEEINRDLLKKSMEKIIFNFRRHKNILGIFLFQDMNIYVNSLDKNIINQKNRDEFTAVSQVDLEKVAECSNLSEGEKINFARFIEKLKTDLLQLDSPLEF